MTYVISVINLKGGVGKTTTTVAMAEILAGELGKRVLVVDLDPQTNSTTMLMGEAAWKDANVAGRTLASLFKDSLRPDGDAPRFDLEKTLVREASPIKAVKTLDLLPSSLDLIDVQDDLASARGGKYHTTTPVELLQKATSSLIPDYDYVLIDCPPNLGIITLNGIRMSQGYVIPTKPDILSTYGIPQIMNRVAGFAEDVRHDVVPLGTIVNMYRLGVNIHENTIRGLKREAEAGKVPKLFRAFIPYGSRVEEAAEFAAVSTLRQRWGPASLFGQLKDLTEELTERAEAQL
ncbi:ParA family protein [Mycolicibacterium sp. P1-18]|uniref:ParA family protein n=1 Tax=Mycolicibacterium sp. P1-18 TaxID=2024615 RepID=UPI0011F401FD|nr:ParA family protein [Mycolicibacterium sp. P1-18]KAA0098886.1 ParA family protein [Mycolicibacterium sp. P1-18]